jgi:hypothetical protein
MDHSMKDSPSYYLLLILATLKVQDRAEDKKNLTFGTTTIHEVKS